jgi:hypothetical protein
LSRSLSSFYFLLLSALGAVPGLGAPPRYDHIVIVIEENHTPGQVIGDTVNCPYITQLAHDGVSFSSMWALTHPSQPNYLHLFSGSAQGVTGDSLVVGYPFTTANLGAELLTAGFTFRGYSEGLRAVGDADWDPRINTFPEARYRRRHNPWSNWQAKTTPIPANQLPAITNDIFSNFPSDLSELPTVSFVIPDLDHDMHDGTPLQADDWLRANLGAYANWAVSHNSLLVVTWDEDDFNEVNRIPTVFFGANLKNGRTSEPTVTLHNLLRTLEDMYGTEHAGQATQCRSISGIFETEPTPRLASFRQGFADYVDASDTFITSGITTSNAVAQDLIVDGDYGGAAGFQPSQALLRFANLFGTGPGQVPANASILSAKLFVQTGPGAANNTVDRIAIHRMNIAWNDTDTWSTLHAGISTKDTDARSVATFSAYPRVANIPVIFDVTEDVEAWKSGVANNGWVLIPDSSTGTDGWFFKSSEATDLAARPTLEIAYLIPNTPFGYWAEDMNLTGAGATPLADIDFDGIVNLVEFAFRTDPRAVDAPLAAGTGTAGLPIVRLVNGPGGSRLELEYVRRKLTSSSGLTYFPEFASEAGQWEQATAAPTITSLDANWERVIVQDAAGIGASKRFAHVRVTSEPGAVVPGKRLFDSQLPRLR